ncbi:MAG: hypothetical protein ABI895_26510 [Deltaproteobacteria bacterium]
MAGHETAVDDADMPGAEINRTCCETRQFENLATPSVARGETTNIPTPSWVTVPWTAAWSLDIPPALALLTSQPARAGPPPPKIPTYIRVRSLLI